jgi:serine/threonine-protein kinase
MCPEQWLDKNLDGRTDIDALGVILFEALTGALPYIEKSNDKLKEMHFNEPVPNISDMKPNLPDAWQEIVNKAMAKSPDDRYGSTGALARDVQELVSGRWFWRNLQLI